MTYRQPTYSPAAASLRSHELGSRGAGLAKLLVVAGRSDVESEKAMSLGTIWGRQAFPQRRRSYRALSTPLQGIGRIASVGPRLLFSLAAAGCFQRGSQVPPLSGGSFALLQVLLQQPAVPR